MKDDFDGPWKEGLDALLPDFFGLCFSEVGGDINWQKGYRALDSELRKVLPKSRTGKRHVDRLYQVWLINGSMAKVFIHVEVQSQQEKEFPVRMLVYRCALRLHYGPQIATFAILADQNSHWRPDKHEESLWGSSLRLRMRVVKLLDFADRTEELEASKNPFASLILAHLKTQVTKDDPQARFTWKMRFVRNLYERGFVAEQVRQLFRLIDWLMRLPDELDEKLEAEVERIEKEKEMPFVTGIERRAEERGKELGKAVGGIRTAIELRFGKVSAQDDELIGRIDDVETLEKLLEIAKQAKTLAEVRKALKQAGGKT